MQLPGSLVDSLDVVALLHECSYSVLKEGKGEVLQRANDVFYNKAQVRACPPRRQRSGRSWAARGSRRLLWRQPPPDA